MPEPGLADWLKTRGLGPFGFRRCEVGRHPHLWHMGTGWPAVFRHLIRDSNAHRQMAAQSPLQTCPAHTKGKAHAATMYEGRDFKVSVGGVEIPLFMQPKKRIPVYVWNGTMHCFVLLRFASGTEPPAWACMSCEARYSRRPHGGCSDCGRWRFFPPQRDR